MAPLASRRRGALAALGLTLWLVPAAGAQVVIDELSTNQAAISDPPGGASSVATGGADILGQHRDGQVKRLAGSGPVALEVMGGAASFTVADTTPDSSGLALLTWDGDADPFVLDPNGLGGVDLTLGGAGGFQLLVDSASAGIGLRIEVWSDAVNSSQAMRVLPAIAAPAQIFVDFTELVPALGSGADLADVGAIRLTIYGGDGSVFALDRITTVLPEVAALKADFDTSGVPLASIAPGGTVRYRVTITNTGSEVRTVDLTDVLDPNTALASAVRSTPIARVDQYQAFADLPFDSTAEGAPALVANDGDPDGNAVVAVPAVGQATSQGGSVTIQANGSFVYMPAAGFLGVDSFTYQIAPVAGDPTADANGAPIPPAVGRAYLLVVPVPPTVTAGGTLAYTENDPPTAIDTTITVTDPDSNVVAATAQITSNYVNGQDLLSCGAPCAGLSPTFVAATGTLSLSGSATPAAYQAALRGVSYENTSDDPDTSTRTVTWIADDGFGTSAPATSSITVAAVNDPPVLTAGATLAYSENDPATAIDTTITIADPDDTNLEGATAQITVNYANGQDVLSFTNMLGISGVWSPATGTLTLSGTSSVANYQTALRSVKYNNTSENPSTLPRTATWIATDGTGSSAPVTSTITVTAVNDPPVAGADAWDTAGNTRLVVDLAPLVEPHVRDTTLSTFGVLDNDADPAEGNAVAVSGIVGCADATPPFGDSPACATTNGGSVVMEANGRFTYTPPAGTVSDDTFQYVATDDGAPPASSNGTVTIHFLARVWYVENDSAAGGLGRSHDPFDTLAEAQTASAANDWIFVGFGDGTSTGQAAGIVLKTGQHLVGEHAGLQVPANFNGNGTNQVLFAAVPGNRPRIDNSGAGNNAVSATDAIPIEIVGLSLQSAAGNAVDLTLTGAFSSSGNLTVLNNEVRGAGAEGIDVNAGGTGILTTTISGNLWTVAGTHTGNGIDVARTGGALRVGLSSNSVVSAATAINVSGGAAASTAVTAFANNVIHQSTGGNGIAVSNATFDADPNQAGYQQIPGGVTTVGVSGDGVGAAAMVLGSVAGDLAFTDLDLFGASALSLSGTGPVNVAAGNGMRLAVGAGVATFQATGGPAVDVSNATADLQLAGMTSASSATTGVSLVNVADAASPVFNAVFSAPPGSSITSATGTAFNVDGGNATISYHGTITNSANRSVVVQNRTGDSATFAGGITDTGTGILVNANNAAATTSFRGGLSLTTGANAAFTATNGGQLEICDENPCNPGATGLLVNNLTTTTGTALDVTSTTISANNLELRSVSAGTAASGPANGIVLNATGASGGLKVKGTGGAASGGTIQRCTGPGVLLTNTSSVALASMSVLNGGDDGIRGNGVTGMSLTSLNVAANGNAVTERGGEFTNLFGASTISGSTFTGSAEDNLFVYNTSGPALTLTITSSTFSNTSAIGNDGIHFRGGNNADMTLSVSNSIFAANRGDHLQATTDAHVTGTVMDVSFQNNTLSGGCAGGCLGAGITLNPGGNAAMTFDILNNGTVGAPWTGAVVSAITINNSPDVTTTERPTLSGTVAGNVIGDPAVNGSGSSTGDGIDLVTNGLGVTTVAVTGNSIRQYSNLYGINMVARDGNNAVPGALNVTATGNTIGNPNVTPPNGFAGEAVFLNAGPVSTDNHAVCLVLGGAAAGEKNSFAGAGANGATDFRVRQRGSTTVRLPGYAGAATNTAAVVTFIQGNNNGSPSGSATVNSPPGGGFVGGAACPLP